MMIKFRGRRYEVVFYEHAKAQMALRNLDVPTVLSVIESGEIKEKRTKNKYWAFKSVHGRKDNMISVALVVEPPHLIVITTLVNWRPK